MNYFRYTMLATLMFAMPLHAMGSGGPRASFLSRCYGYASSWISSSFLVTREFVRRELGAVSRQLNDLNSRLSALNVTASNLKNDNAAIREDLALYGSAFADVAKGHGEDLERCREELAIERGRQEKNAASIQSVHLATQTAEREVSSAYAELEKLKKSNNEERESFERQRSEVLQEQKKLLSNKIDAHIAQNTNRINKGMALLENLRQETLVFGDKLDLALLEAKERDAQQEKQSRQLKQLNIQVEEQNRKVMALAAAFNGFKADFYASRTHILPQTNIIPGPGPFPGRKNSQVQNQSVVPEKSQGPEMEDVE